MGPYSELVLKTCCRTSRAGEPAGSKVATDSCPSVSLWRRSKRCWVRRSSAIGTCTLPILQGCHMPQHECEALQIPSWRAFALRQREADPARQGAVAAGIALRILAPAGRRTGRSLIATRGKSNSAGRPAEQRCRYVRFARDAAGVGGTPHFSGDCVEDGMEASDPRFRRPVASKLNGMFSAGYGRC